MRRLHLSTQEEAVISEEAFTVSFTDFSIILLAFFIFIDSVTTPDAIRQSAITDALSKEFSRKGYTKEAGSPLGILDIAEEARFEVTRGKGEFSITIPGAELFRSGDDKVRPELVPLLEAIALKVGENDLTVRIEGHTDNKPIQTARFPSNWALSVARAVSVLRLFADKGIPLDHLSAAGRAEFLPVASNDTEQGRAANRRVLLHISAREVEASGY